MSIRLVATDIDLEEGVMLRLDFTSLCRRVGLHHYLFLFPPPKPMYNTIWSHLYVQYDLVLPLGMIQSGGVPMYDINLRATYTIILSTRGVTIPIYLVSSATDSIRRHVVLFKPVPILTSDPKSEFLCQSSLQLCRAYRPP